MQALNRHGLTNIDLESPAYKAFKRELAFEVIQVFTGVRADDKTGVCVAQAKVWHRFVELIHGANGLPSPAQMVGRLRWDSDAEESVLNNGVFKVDLTHTQRKDWEVIVGRPETTPASDSATDTPGRP